MFEKVSLKRNGWHAKLQKWTFGFVPYENNFCPFFWLGVFCMLAFPSVVLYRYVLKYIGIGLAYCVIGPLLVLEKAVDFIDNKFCKPLFVKRVTNYVDTMSDVDAFDLFEYMFGWNYFVEQDLEQGEVPTTLYNFRSLKSKVQDKYRARWNEWKARAGDGWIDKIKAAREKQLEYEKEVRESKQENDRRRKEFYNNLIKYTKLFVYLPIGAVLIYALYGLGLLGIFIAENLSLIGAFFTGLWELLVWLTPWVGLIALGTIVVILLCTLVVNLSEKCSLSLPGKKLFKKAWSPFGSFGSFFVMYFRAFKENHCPSIQWDDD